MFVSEYTSRFFNTRIVRSVLFFVFLNTFIYNSLGQLYNARTSKGVVRSSIDDKGIAEKIAIGDDETKYVCSQLLKSVEVKCFDPDMNEINAYSFDKSVGTVLHINDAEFDNGKLYVVGSFNNTITVKGKDYTPFTNCVLSFLLVLDADLTIEFFGILGDKNGDTEYATTVINSVAIVDDVVSLGGYYGTKTNFALIEADDIPYDKFTNGGFVVQYDKSKFHFKSKVFFENGDVQAIAKMSNGSIAVLAGFGVNDIKVIVNDDDATAVAYSKVAVSRNFLVLELSPDLHFEERYIFGSDDNPTYDLSDLICNADGCVLGGLAQGTGTLVTPNLTTVSNSFTTDPFLIYFNQGLEPKWATIIPHVTERLNVYGLGYDMHEKVFVITSGSGITNTNSKGRLDFVNINGEVTQTYENSTAIFYGVTNSAAEFQIVGSSKSLSDFDMMGGSNLFPNLSFTTNYNSLVLTLEDACPTNDRLYVNNDASGTGDGKTWTNAMTSLDNAIAVANSCPNIQEIWVARGKYIPNSTEGFILPPNVDLIGGFLGTETNKEARGDVFENRSELSGSGGEKNHVLNIQNAGNVIVDGFRIFEGSATMTGNANDQMGGGILINNTSATILNTFLGGNKATRVGGAISVIGTSVVHIENCVLEGNSANEGGGIYFEATAGASPSSIVNTTFYKSQSTETVGVDIYTNSPVVLNVANILSHAPNGVETGYSLKADQGTMNVFNSGFSTEETKNTNFINYTNIIENQTFDFVTGFELDPSSPGVDFGDSRFVTLTTDILGNQRIQGITVDIGATETVSSCAKPYLVTSTEDTYTIPICGELRYAVMAASNAGNKTVTFDPTVFKDSTTIKLTDKIVLDGEGVTIDGFVGGKQLIHITKSDPTLYGFDISGHANTIQGLTFGASTSEIPMIFIEGYKNRLLSNWFGVDPDGKEVAENSSKHVAISGDKNIIGGLDSGNVFMNTQNAISIQNQGTGVGVNADGNYVLANFFGVYPVSGEKSVNKIGKYAIYLGENATSTNIGDNTSEKMNVFYPNGGLAIGFGNKTAKNNRVFGNVFLGQNGISTVTDAQESIQPAEALSFNILDSTFTGKAPNATKVSIYISKSAVRDIGELFIKDVDVSLGQFSTVLNLDTISVDYDMITVISHSVYNSSSIFSNPLAICRNPFYVDKTVDDPNVCGSIRLANTIANLNKKPDTITFKKGITITLDSTLFLTEGKTYYKGLFNNTDKVPDVQFKSSSLTFEALKIQSDSNIIEGVEWRDFGGSDNYGIIRIEKGVGNVLRASYIGFNSSDNSVATGGLAGIYIGGDVKRAIIGESGFGNYICGNSKAGIFVGPGADSTLVQYNSIGQLPSKVALGNQGEGILVDLSNATVVFVDSNIIGNNVSFGISASGSTGNVSITNNHIGLDGTGNQIIGNGDVGINGSNGTFLIEGNVITGNENGGIHLANSSYYIKNNKIGLSLANQIPSDGSGHGIEIDDPTTSGIKVIEGNVISANKGSGIYIDGDQESNTLIENNFIGTNRLGTLDLGNGEYGISINSSDHFVIRKNLISGNGASGIYLGLGNELINVYGNTIGLNLAKDGILKNEADGITIVSDRAQVVIDSANVIAGNGSSGITLAGAKNIQITRNYIGTNPSLDPSLGNQKYGIVLDVNNNISPTGNVIGGYGLENFIFENGNDGIAVESGFSNTFFKNNWTGNGDVTKNISISAGEQNGITRPVLTSVDPDLLVTGSMPLLAGVTIDPSTDSVYLYADVDDEGAMFLGAGAIQTDNSYSFKINPADTVGLGQMKYFQVLANVGGNTSDFSEALEIDLTRQAPEKICAHPNGSGTVDIHWSTVAGVTDYKLIYAKDTVKGTTFTEETVTAPGTSFSVTGLDNDEFYFFAVIVDNDTSDYAVAVPVVEAGRAMDFSNSDTDYIVVNNNSIYNFSSSSSFAVELWFKADNLPTETVDLISSRLSGSEAYAFQIRQQQDGSFNAISYDGTNYVRLKKTVSYTDGLYHHLAYVYDGTAFSLYIDGKLVQSANWIYGEFQSPTQGGLVIGARNITGFQRDFNGVIDEVRIWNKALTALEINNRKDIALLGNEAGLVGLWHFDEPSGNIAYDASCNGNNGVLVNSPTSVPSKAMHPFQDTIMAVANGGQVDITWNTNVATDVDTIAVYRKEGAAGVWKLISSGLNTNSFSDLSPVNDSLFYYVESVDANGQIGVASLEDTVVFCGNPLVVTKTTDDSTCGTLRYAINYANATTGADEIKFNITGGTLPYTINLQAALPALTDAAGTVIDGFSQPGAKANTNAIFSTTATLNTVHGIALGGLDVVKNALTLTSDNNSIIGLVLSDYGTSAGDLNNVAVTITGNNNKILGCIIGLDVSGTTISTKTHTGVSIIGSDNSIGDGTNLGVNVISGTSNFGVHIYKTASVNSIKGNILGLQKDGASYVVGNKQLIGVYVEGDGNTIGGKTPEERNIVSGNKNYGVLISNSNSNVIKGNYVGLNKDGNAVIANSSQGIGIYLAGTSEANIVGEGNVVSGNTSEGITSNSSAVNGNTIIGNIVGPQADGTTYLASSTQNRGVLLSGAPNNKVGGTTVEERNVISGNISENIYISGATSTGNEIIGNYIGTDKTGLSKLLSSNQATGVHIDGGASNNKIGGTAVGESNIIAFNSNGINATALNTVNNKFSSNSIHSNIKGININYGSVEANGGKSFPVIASATPVLISGTCELGDIVEVFNDSPQSGTTNQGREFLGTATVVGATWSYPGVFAVGDRITTTATDATNGTSEFSVAVLVQEPLLLAPATVCAKPIGKTVEVSWAEVVGATSYTVSYGIDTTGTLFTKVVNPPSLSTVISTYLVLDNINYFSVAANGGEPSIFEAAVPVVEAGKALKLNGTSQYVSVNNTGVLDLTGSDFTLETWVKFDALKFHSIISTHDGSGSSHKGYSLSLEDDGSVKMFIGNGKNFVSFTQLVSNQKLKVDEWYHIAVVHDKNNMELKLFINGKLDASISNSFSVTSKVDVPLLFGYRAGGYNDGYLDGEIDEVRIWNVIRSNEDISDFKDKLLLDNTTGLVGLWHFDEPSGDIAYDATCNGNNGTWKGAVSSVSSKAMHPFTDVLTAQSNEKGDSIFLSWNTNLATDIAEYRVYQSQTATIDTTGLTPNFIVTALDTTLGIGGFVTCDTLWYFVYGVDASGQVGNVFYTDSAVVCPPLVRSKVCALASNSQVALSWDAVTGATNGYKVIWTTTASDTTKPLATYGSRLVAGVDTIITGLSNDQLYYFAVVSDNGDTSTWTGAVPVVESGRAMSGFSMNDYIQISGLLINDFPAYTIEAWVKPNSLSEYQTIFEFDDDSPFFGLQYGVPTVYSKVSAIDPILLNEWVHLAVTFDTLSGDAKIYVNGVLSKVETNVVGSYKVSDFTSGIGYHIGDEPFDGEIDEVRVWSVARSVDQINDAKDTPLLGTETDLVGLWHFDEPSGTIAYDGACSGYNGVYINTPTSVPSKAMHPFKPTDLQFLGGKLSWSPNIAKDIASTTIQKWNGISWDSVGTVSELTTEYDITNSNCESTLYRVYAIDKNGQIGVVSDSIEVGASSTLTDGLALRLPFDGNIIDASGNGNSATAVGFTPTFMDDELSNPNSGIVLNGSMLSVPDHSTLSSASGHSFAYWLYINPGATGGLTHFSKGHDEQGYHAWSFPVPQKPNYYTIGYYPNITGSDQKGIQGKEILSGVWNHIVFTNDNSGNLQVYVNGVLTKEVTGEPTILDPALGLNIGSTGNNSYTLKGGLNDFRMYNRVISAEEVSRLARSVVPDSLNLCSLPQDIVATTITGATYTWTKPGATTSSTETISADVAGQYIVSVNDGACIQISDTLEVIAFQVDTSVVVSATSLCLGDESIISTAANDSITWFRNGVELYTTTSSVFQTFEPGNYKALMYSGTCLDSNVVTINGNVGDDIPEILNVTKWLNSDNSLVINNTDTLVNIDYISNTSNSCADGLFIYPNTPLDMSINKSLALVLLTDKPIELLLIPGDGTSEAYNSSTLINNSVQTIPADGSFHLISFDYSDIFYDEYYTVGPVDSTSISYFQIRYANCSTDDFSGNLTIKELYTFDPNGSGNLFVEDSLVACSTPETLDAGESVNWTLPDMSVVPNQQTLVVTEQGWYKAESLGSCTITDSIFVALNTVSDTVYFPNGLTYCAGDSIYLATNHDADSIGWLYNGSIDGVMVSDTGSYLPQGTSGTIAFVKYFGECTDTTKEVTITEIQTTDITLNITNDTTICFGESIDINLAEDNDTISWYSTNGISTSLGSDVALSFTGSTEGVDSIYAIVGLGSCADTTAKIRIEVLLPLDSILVYSDLIIDGISDTLYSSTGVNVDWYLDGEFVITDAGISIDSPGEYYFTQTNGICSVNSDTVTMSLEDECDSVLEFATLEYNLCAGESVDLTPSQDLSSDYTYSWFNLAGDNLGTDVSAIDLEEGYYILGTLSSDANCDLSSDTIVVDIEDAIDTTLSPDGILLTVFDTDTILNAIDEGTTISWYKDDVQVDALDNLHAVLIDEAGSYYFIKTDGLCSDTSRTIIVNFEDECDFAITGLASSETYCGNKDGLISISGLDDTKLYDVYYNDTLRETGIQSVGGNHELGALKSGVYTNLTLQDENGLCKSNTLDLEIEVGSFDVISVSASTPLSCDQDGLLTIDGLVSDEEYLVHVSGQLDQSLIATNGMIDITLPVGEYDEVSVEKNACVSNIVTAKIDSAAALIISEVTKTGITKCGLATGDGEITITGLFASNGNTFELDGEIVNPQLSGSEAVFASLDEGQHTIQYLEGSCKSNILNFEMTAPTEVVIDTIIKVNPTGCGLATGSVSIKLANNITDQSFAILYGGEYQFDNTSLNSSLSIPLMTAGTYDISLISNETNCASTNSKKVTLIDGNAPKIILSESKSGNCGDASGYINFTGFTAPSYTMTYLQNGVLETKTIQGLSSYKLEDLASTSYSDFLFVGSEGCLSVIDTTIQITSSAGGNDLTASVSVVDSTICDNNSFVKLNVVSNSSSIKCYQWYLDGVPLSGDTTIASINALVDGLYSVKVDDGDCKITTRAVNVTVSTDKFVPVISKENDQLIVANVSNGVNYQWYVEYNSEEYSIVGAKKNSYNPFYNGMYSVSYSNGYCTFKSLPFAFEDRSFAISRLPFETSGDQIWINEGRDVINFSINPNPASDQIQLQYSSATKGELIIEVVNATGTLVWSGIYPKDEFSFDKQISFDWPTGVYHFKLVLNNQVQTSTIVIEEN